ncbi:hypothetical protein BV898_11827 [Hypsibius exemplaris]|uniref:Stathmin n=1 Tax=Hypsibius exemplaris TaxID=2072580 RepID=A0A1W0WFF3_HYPEX|nr:hypothetical protein BV898_11827 [Hypsibius exemplaris]
MALNGNGDASSSAIHFAQEHQEFLASVGSPTRVSRNGLAFVVPVIEEGGSAGPILSLETSVTITRPGDASETGEAAVTAQQIQEKLAAAGARREAAINDLRNKAVEESSRIEKARLVREESVTNEKEALKVKIDQDQIAAAANQEAAREILLSKLKKEELHHQEVRARKAAEFQDRLSQLDSKYTDRDGKRDMILSDMVEKLREHNEKVKATRDAFMAVKEKNMNEPEDLLKERYDYATGERDAFFDSAENRLQQGNFKLRAEGDENDNAGAKLH